MKKILIILLVTVSYFSNAQESEFTFTHEKGMTDYIVTPVEGKTASETYKKTIEWIKLTYKNPEKVVLSTIDNEFIRFEGTSEKLYSYGGMGQMYVPTKYQIEISIKDGKYKFDLVGIQELVSGNWREIIVFNSKMSKEDLEKAYVFKKDGTLRSSFKFANEVPTYFNELNTSLSESITSTVKQKNEW